MTTITGKAGVGGGIAPATLGPNDSYLLVRSVEVVTTAAGTTIQPIASRHKLNTDGTFSITVEALAEGFAYEFVFSLNGGEYLSPPRTCAVPASGTVAYKDLVDVVPIDHTGYGAPGWLLEILAGGGGGGGGGTPGQSPELRATATHIQWKLPSSPSWNNLVALADLEGTDGINGTNGTNGTNGQEVSLQLTATHIQWRLGTGTWANLVALADLKGAKGDPGNEVSLQLTATHIQWRLGTGTWANLVALADLKGAKGDPGDSIELQVTATHIQWRSGAGTWTNLIALADLKGEPGEPGTGGGGGSATFTSLGGEPGDNPALAAVLATKLDRSEAELMVMRVFHGGDQWFPRPDVPNPLDWAGWVEPVNMLDGVDFYCVLAEPADSFTGAFDSFGVPRLAYSLRRMLTAYTGPLVRVRRSSDSTELDIAATADGDLDTDNLLAFAGAGSAYVVTWYDQTNNGRHLVQATQAAQPRLVNAGVLDVVTATGKPRIMFDGSNDYLAGAHVGLYAAGAATLSMVAGFSPDTADTVFGEVGDSNQFSYRLARIGAGSASPLWRGSISTTPTAGWSLAAPAGDLTFDGNLHHLFVADSGTQIWQYQDQIERLAGTTATRGTAPTLTRTSLGAAAYNTPSGFATGFVQELVAWASDERDDRAAISAASKSYWGTP